MIGDLLKDPFYYKILICSILRSNLILVFSLVSQSLSHSLTKFFTKTRSVSANDMFVQFNARRKGTTIRINKAERMESLKIRLIPQFKKILKGNTVTK